MPAKKKLTPYKASKASQNMGVKEETSKNQGLKIKRAYIIGLIALIVVVGLIFLARSLFIVAMVNGEPVTRLAVIRELEMQGGKQISESLITETLVRQKAREQGITATAEEIEREIKTLEELYKEQGQDLEQVLSMRGMTRADLERQIELKIFLDKLTGNIEVTDEEVQQFIDENNEAYGGTLTAEDVRTQLEEQKRSERSSQIITELQSQANIQHFVEY